MSETAPVQQPAAAGNSFAALREKNAQYNRAVQLMNDGDYDGASAAFAAAGDYRDAAAAMFAALGEIGFRDAAERVKEFAISADEMYDKGNDYYYGRGVDQE